MHDSSLYRYRVNLVMSTPIISCKANDNLAKAANIMSDRKASSVFVLGDHKKDGPNPYMGIITERDILRAAAKGVVMADAPASHYASGPVITINQSAFLYAAIGLMGNKNIRHLLVVDDDEKPVGVITSRLLLKMREGDSFALQAGLERASKPTELSQTRDKLPILATRLYEDKLAALDVAAIISQIYRDISARAFAIALAETEEPPPTERWSFLMLGSGGRGESLLVPDQDNALVYDHSEGLDPKILAQIDKGWQHIAATANKILDQAGIPFCKGGVMAKNFEWRHSYATWQRLFKKWQKSTDPNDVLAQDIFFDFIGMAGDNALAKNLKKQAVSHINAGGGQLWQMASALNGWTPPLGFFGRFKQVSDGRIDLKKGALFPLVAGTRIMALKAGIEESGTLARLHRLDQAGKIDAGLRAQIKESLETIMGAILSQQIDDYREKMPLSSLVATKRFNARKRREVIEAMRLGETMIELARDHASQGPTA